VEVPTGVKSLKGWIRLFIISYNTGGCEMGMDWLTKRITSGLASKRVVLGRNGCEKDGFVTVVVWTYFKAFNSCQMMYFL
jgi:hypothetical protein